MTSMNLFIGQTMSLNTTQSLYASRMSTGMTVKQPTATESTAPASPAPAEPAMTTAYTSTMEMSLELNVRMQLQSTTTMQPVEEPSVKPAEHDDENEHGDRQTLDRLGHQISKMGRAMGRKIRHMAEELDLSKSDRAELKDMVHDLKHDLKDAFRGVGDDDENDDHDDHGHHGRRERPDAMEAYTAATDALEEFAQRLKAFADRVAGVEEQPAEDPSLLPVEPKPDESVTPPPAEFTMV